MNIIFISLGILFSIVLVVIFAFVAVTYTHYKLNKKANNSILIFANMYEFRYLANIDFIERLETFNKQLNNIQLDYNEVELSNYYIYLSEYLFKKYFISKLLRKYYYYSEDLPNLKENYTKLYYKIFDNK